MSSTRVPGYAEGFHVIPEPRPAARPRMAGTLAATVSAEAVDALIRGLDEAKAERVVSYRDATDQA